MSPFAPQVVAAAALMSSPVFYQVLVAGTAPLDFALTRFLVIWVVTWVVLSLVVELLFPSRLETERRIRDIELAAREVRKELERAEADAARERAQTDEAAAGLRTLDELLDAPSHDAVAAHDDRPGDDAGDTVPTPRSPLHDAAPSDAAGGHRAS